MSVTVSDPPMSTVKGGGIAVCVCVCVCVCNALLIKHVHVNIIVLQFVIVIRVEVGEEYHVSTSRTQRAMGGAPICS